MTIAVLASQMNLDEQPFWVNFLSDKHMKILMMFAAAQAACNNLRASILATYIYYLTLDNSESVIMFIKDLPKMTNDIVADEKSNQKNEEEKEEDDSMKMFY